MVRIFVSLLALAAMILPARAADPVLSLYGVTLGQPLKAPECQREKSSPDKYAAPSGRDGPCAQRANEKDVSWGGRAVTVVFPEAKDYSYPYPGFMSVAWLNGRVTMLGIPTYGQPSQAATLKLLQEKLGKPTEGNLAAGKMEWIFADYEVTWRREDDIKSSVTVIERKYMDAMLKWQAAKETTQKSPEPSLFGVVLGQPLTVEECPHNKNSPKNYDHSSATQKGLCAEREAGTDERWGGRSVKLYFPSTGWPDYMQREVFSVSLVDGKVVEIAFATLGRPVERDVVENLKEKFGTPDEVTNGGHDFYWKFPDFHAQYYLDKPNWGIIQVMSPIYIEKFNKWVQSQKKTPPKM